jgi:hypothetical protein
MDRIGSAYGGRIGFEEGGWDMSPPDSSSGSEGDDYGGGDDNPPVGGDPGSEDEWGDFNDPNNPLNEPPVGGDPGSEEEWGDLSDPNNPLYEPPVGGDPGSEEEWGDLSDPNNPLYDDGNFIGEELDSGTSPYLDIDRDTQPVIGGQPGIGEGLDYQKYMANNYYAGLGHYSTDEQMHLPGAGLDPFGNYGIEGMYFDNPTYMQTAEVLPKDIKRSKERQFKGMDYDLYKMFNPGTKVSPFEFKGLQEGTITEPGIYTAAEGGIARLGYDRGGPIDFYRYGRR